MPAPTAEAPTERLDTATAGDDLFVSRARPTFLYVIYAMILAALPIGAIAAFRPAVAAAISAGISAYLKALPEPLYTLFGVGYLGYTAARQWGKASGGTRRGTGAPAGN